jgi:hypothetical protein
MLMLMLLYRFIHLDHLVNVNVTYVLAIKDFESCVNYGVMIIALLRQLLVHNHCLSNYKFRSLNEC